MFTKTKAFSGFSVDDVTAARTFYGDTLGINVTTLWRKRRRYGIE